MLLSVDWRVDVHRNACRGWLIGQGSSPSCFKKDLFCLVAMRHLATQKNVAAREARAAESKPENKDEMAQGQVDSRIGSIWSGQLQ